MNEDVVNILAVDDAPGCLLVLEHVLAKLDMVRFFGVSSEEEAINLSEEYEFAVILADVAMHGMGGFEMAKRIRDRKHGRDTPVIFISAQLHDHDYIAQVYRSGGVDSMLKPIDPVVLKSKVSIFANIYLQRKRLNRAICQQLEMKNRFLSQVSHELKTPLNSLNQFLQILESERVGRVNPDQKEFLNIALRNAGNLNEMIDDLMEVTRIESGKLSINKQDVCLRTLFEEAAESLQHIASERAMTIHLSVSDAMPAVHADPKRLRQVLVNLVTNAIRYGTEGMAITISGGVSAKSPAMAEISVADEGPGIAPDRIAHIFERLYQIEDRDDVKRQGLGLGLHICKEFVQAHGGRIGVVCPPEGGAVFRFTVSLKSETVPEQVTEFGECLQEREQQLIPTRL